MTIDQIKTILGYFIKYTEHDQKFKQFQIPKL